MMPQRDRISSAKIGALLAMALLAAATLIPATATAQGGSHAAHVHGLARLAVVVDGPQLHIAFESPLHNLVGFEHAPRTAEQREAVARMMAALNAPADVFAPTAAAACSPVRIAIESPWLVGTDGHDDHHDHHHAHDHDHDHDHGHGHGHDHADLYAEYEFHCDAPSELHGLEVGLFAHFPGIERIQAELATPGSQSAIRLDAGTRELRWR
jgi:hypothetical protein